MATLADEIQEGEIAGTAAYMAPEQLREGQSTIQSDLYALGLILYEMFTGEAVNKASSLQELLNQDDSSPSEPSNLVDDIDPVLERVILRCLEKEPHERPRSASAVGAALPGGDPLAAALAAGETPSPEMVAAAGGVIRYLIRRDPRDGRWNGTLHTQTGSVGTDHHPWMEWSSQCSTGSGVASSTRSYETDQQVEIIRHRVSQANSSANIEDPAAGFLVGLSQISSSENQDRLTHKPPRDASVASSKRHSLACVGRLTEINSAPQDMGRRTKTASNIAANWQGQRCCRTWRFAHVAGASSRAN